MPSFRSRFPESLHHAAEHLSRIEGHGQRTPRLPDSLVRELHELLDHPGVADHIAASDVMIGAYCRLLAALTPPARLDLLHRLTELVTAEGCALSLCLLDPDRDLPPDEIAAREAVARSLVWLQRRGLIEEIFDPEVLETAQAALEVAQRETQALNFDGDPHVTP